MGGVRASSGYTHQVAATLRSVFACLLACELPFWVSHKPHSCEILYFLYIEPAMYSCEFIGCRVENLSGASKDAPSTGSAPAHGPLRAGTPPLSQSEPFQQHCQQNAKPGSASADKDGAVQSDIHQEADTGNSPMQS